MVTEPQGHKPRGRAASEIRTGRFIRDYLERYGEGYLSEIHSSLKSEIGKHNLLRPKSKWLRSPTYESFVKYFGHLRRLHLVEWVRDEPTEFVFTEKLLSIRMTGPWQDAEPMPTTEVVRSTRRVYRLSNAGRDPRLDFIWDDPLVRSPFRQALAATAQELLSRMSQATP